MADNTLILDGDEPMDHFNLEEDIADLELAVDGDDEEELFDDAEIPEELEDDDFKLDGPETLGPIVDAADDEDDENTQGQDIEYEDNIIGQKRKRVKVGAPATNTRAFQRSAMRIQAGNVEAFILEEDDALTSKPSSRVPGTFGRRNRKKGETLPAYHKRVSHELDSDDELMMDMREKGFSDRQIAEKLAKDGRVRYDQKSISTRIMRIRLAQADNVDFLLREGYKEWEFDDDCLLMQAYALADIEVNYEIERVRAWRFKKVSEYMRRLKKDALFSATACRERYSALIEGTARIPTDMDDNPETRRMELETYRVAREEIRVKEQDEKDAQEATERKAKDEARILNAQKAEEVAFKRQKIEDEKAARAVKRAAAAQVRRARAGENATAKAARNAQIQKQKVAVEKKIPKGKPIEKKTSKSNDSLTIANSKITVDTTDPRGYLSVADLSKMCADRGFETTGKDKEALLDDLKDADEEWSMKDLQKMCRSKGLNIGTKLQMRHQLALAAAQACESFRAAADAAGEDVVMDEG